MHRFAGFGVISATLAMNRRFILGPLLMIQGVASDLFRGGGPCGWAQSADDHWIGGTTPSFSASMRSYTPKCRSTSS
jgi:hypothetical protein